MRKEWELKKIGECFSYIKNGANIKQTKGAGGYPITRIETLSGGVFNRDRLGYADVVDLEQYKDYILESGDLLVSHINSKTYIGRTVVYEGKQGENIIHGMNLLRLKHNRSLINSAFLCYYTQSISFKLDIMRIRKDAVNQSSFAISDFKKIRIPVPVLATQISIVSELDKLNELIQIKKEQLKDYDALAQSIFYEMFGDPVVNEKGWEVKKFGDLFKLKSGDGLSSKDFKTGVYPVYGGNGISGYHDSFNMNGDYIIIGRVGVYCGNVRKVSGKFWLTDNAFKLIYHQKEQVSVFILYLLNILDLHQYANAAAQPVISNLTLKYVNIILPPLSLQQSFAQKIEQIEQQKAAIQKTITDLETLLAARMQYWFD